MPEATRTWPRKTRAGPPIEKPPASVHQYFLDRLARDGHPVLDIPIEPDRWDAIVEHRGFDHMKRHATRSAPLGGMFWDGGAQTSIRKGTNGRWRDVLTPEDCARYERMAFEEPGA